MEITKIEAQKRHKNRSSVYLDHQFAFGIADFDLLRLHLKEGQTITEEELQHIQDEILLQDARQYALKLLDRQSYTESAIRRKLKDHGASNDVIEKTISFLLEYRYLDDEDYARRYLSAALHSGKSGLNKIRNDLLVKGIAKDLIETIISELDGEELYAAQQDALMPIIQKKLNGDYSFPNVMKVKRYCLGRGFSADSIDSVLQKLKIEREEWSE